MEDTNEHDIDINNITFSQDGQLFTVASSYGDGGQFNIWKLNRNEIPSSLASICRSPPKSICQKENNKDQEFLDISLSLNNQMVAIASRAGKVRRWELNPDGTLKKELNLERHDQKDEKIAYSVGFSANGKMLASGDEDGRISLWKTDSGKLISFP